MVCQQFYLNLEVVGCFSQLVERVGGSWLFQGIFCRQDFFNGFWGLSYFCFCLFVFGFGDKYGNQLWFLIVTEEFLVWGGRDVCGFSEMVFVCGFLFGQFFSGLGGLGGSQVQGEVFVGFREFFGGGRIQGDLKIFLVLVFDLMGFIVFFFQ